MYIRVVHCLGSLCGCPAPPQSSNNTHHAHISTPPPACTPFLPLPARSPHTREPTRQINRQLATASYAFANGIWLPGKGYINNTARNRRPPVVGEGEGEEVRMGLPSQRVRAKIQHFCDPSVCPTVSRSGLASATRRLDAASRSKWGRESLTIAIRDWDWRRGTALQFVLGMWRGA